jgi:hypothetical protein
MESRAFITLKREGNQMAEIDISKRCELSIKILQKTNDGDDLEPWHLSLLENAVNNNLTEAGWERLIKIHDEVLAGTYKKPWFHDVENLTVDHVGYVYWKGIEVEHYTHPYRPANKSCAEELGVRCRYLESKSIPVNTRSAIWRWHEDYEADFKASQQPA